MNENVTLDINPETVSHIVNLAREFYGGEEIYAGDEEPEKPAGDWELETAQESVIDPIRSGLKSAIEDLEPDQQVQLVALMWLGRGSFSEWEGAVEEARDNWTTNTADYLIGTPLLSDYLVEGLSRVGYFVEDFEV